MYVMKKIETVKLINKDTIPCPSCGNMITKISGCDQMWCPECKNAWSWSKGVVVFGYIHNPHYFEYQKKWEILKEILMIYHVEACLIQWLYIRYVKINPIYYININHMFLMIF